jgi:hypothetical protein
MNVDWLLRHKVGTKLLAIETCFHGEDYLYTFQSSVMTDYKRILHSTSLLPFKSNICITSNTLESPFTSSSSTNHQNACPYHPCVRPSRSIRTPYRPGRRTMEHPNHGRTLYGSRHRYPRQHMARRSQIQHHALLHARPAHFLRELCRKLGVPKGINSRMAMRRWCELPPESDARRLV